MPLKKTVFLYCWDARQTRIYHVKGNPKKSEWDFVEAAQEMDAKEYPENKWVYEDFSFDVFDGFIKS